jgi:hypothetical protein
VLFTDLHTVGSERRRCGRCEEELERTQERVLHRCGHLLDELSARSWCDSACQPPRCTLPHRLSLLRRQQQQQLANTACSACLQTWVIVEHNTSRQWGESTDNVEINKGNRNGKNAFFGLFDKAGLFAAADFWFSSVCFARFTRPTTPYTYPPLFRK